MSGADDPTAADVPLPEDHVARLSGNETAMLCLKAARGAGMFWGLAEEAGYGARWLSDRGIAGAGALAAHLDWAEGRPWQELAPRALDDLRPRSAGGRLCPIALGAALSDRGGLTAPEEAGPVGAPVLLLPFLHMLARAAGHPVQLRWPGGAVGVTPGGALRGAADALTALPEARLVIAPGAPDGAARSTAAPPAPEVLARLEELALKTAVPATGASRVDAGAAGGDND